MTNLDHIFGEGNGIPLQYSCMENPMDGGAWWAAVHGVATSWTRLSDFTFTFHFHALEEEMAIHSSVLAWRIPGMAGPGGQPSMGSHRVRHNWSDLAAAAAAADRILKGRDITLSTKVHVNGHGFGWTQAVGDGQGGLACYGSWGRRESDMTELLNWTELNLQVLILQFEEFNGKTIFKVNWN